MGSYAGLARAVEQLPVQELTVHDVVWWRPVWPILTLVAANTERVRLGPDVTHPYLRHPVETAASIAAIDELSGGRAILGLGAGSLLESVGIEGRRPRVAVRECAELVQRFLAGKRTPYEGEIFHASAEATFFWSPLRRGVPVFIGALGPRMVESAATWAEELRPSAIWAPEFFVDLKSRAEEAAQSAGRTGISVGCNVWLSLDQDRMAARALGRSALAPFLAIPQFAPLRDFYEIDAAEVAEVGRSVATGDVEGAARRISDETLDTFVAAGNAADIAAGVQRLVDAGASSITFSGRLGPDPAVALRLLGEQVLSTVI
jgi:5,10-methylenetetrahydromethanopterin reductase